MLFDIVTRSLRVGETGASISDDSVIYIYVYELMLLACERFVGCVRFSRCQETCRSVCDQYAVILTDGFIDSKALD